MALPEKDYYSLEETAQRWKISLADLQYYVTHEEIEVLVWLNVGVINLYQHKRTEDGSFVPVISGLKSYRNYAILLSDDLRRIFRCGVAHARQFTNPETLEQIEIHESHSSYEVRGNDIVIGRLERDRLEQLYELSCDGESMDSPYSKPSSFAGRPSAMYQVKQHFLERCRSDQILPSLQQEADYLSHWAQEHIKDCQSPKAKTIMNALRADYRVYRSSLSTPKREADKRSSVESLPLN